MPYQDEKSESDKSEVKKKKKSKALTFPWWCKIIAFILSFIFMGVSAFFVIIKGIDFGEEKCNKWLTSLVISFFTSVLLTQPIKVIKKFFYLKIYLFFKDFIFIKL